MLIMRSPKYALIWPFLLGAVTLGLTAVPSVQAGAVVGGFDSDPWPPMTTSRQTWFRSALLSTFTDSPSINSTSTTTVM